MAVAAPGLLFFNEPLAAELGLDAAALQGPAGAAVFAGNLVPEGADAPGAAISRAAQAFWQRDWQGQSFMAVGAQDPVLGPPTMDALRAHIRGCPPPMLLPDAGHFVPEWGEPVAREALRRC